VTKRGSNTGEQARQRLMTFRLLFLIAILFAAVSWQAIGNRYVRHYVRIFIEQSQMTAGDSNSKI
jgi:hypothetical protein